MTGEPVLTVDELRVGYGGAVALDGVSFGVERGELLAIVGANGAGKTTPIRAIAGMVKPLAGRVRYRGEDITGLPLSEVCERGVAQVAEARQIFPTLSVLENLEAGAMLRRARAGRRRNLDRVFTLFPRLAERHRQAAGTMSGGEQQMLAIGRCLMGEPELVMFDEPSLGLAPAVVAAMFDVIRSLSREGLTILLVEQNVRESLELCRHALVLENGKVAMSGAGRDLLGSDRIRVAYLGL